MRLSLLVVGILVVTAAANPASFVCDIHNQTFIRGGTISQNGLCFDVYTHSYPTHRVQVRCR